MGQDYIDELEKTNKIIWRADRAYRKLLIQESQENIKSIISIPTRNGSEEIKRIFNSTIFDKSKPHNLVKHLSKYILDSNDLILDFFAGSGTTAHAVMQLNAEDGGNRRFICVQLPEEIDAKAEAAQAGFTTIAEIAKERIRRAGRQIRENLPADTPLDTGFKVFKQGASAFNNGQPPAGVLRETPDLYVDTVKADSNRENLLYELMLRFGLPLTCPVNFDADREIHWVENEHSQVFAFLLSQATPELIDHLCHQRPDKVIALDKLFSDELKINSALRFEEAGIGYEWL